MKKIKLREIQSILSKHRVQATSDYVAYLNPETLTWSYLPELRTKSHTKYSCLLGYSKHLDRMIAKHGPDAEFEYLEETNSSLGRNEKPIGGSNDDDQPKGVREGRSSTSNDRCEGVMDGKQGGESYPNLSLNSRRSFSATNNGDTPGGNSGDSLSGVDGRGVESSTSGSGVPKDEIQFGPSRTRFNSDDSQQASTNNFIGNKPGVGTLADAKGKDAFRPMNIDGTGLKTMPNLEANEGTTSTWSSSDWGMYPHPSYSTSFKAFTNKPTYELPPIKASLPSYERPKAMTATEELAVTEGGSISTEDRFGSSNPGGFIDEAMGRLKSKSQKAQARSIQQRMEMIFRDTEIGCGQTETPRMSASKLTKELVGRSTRMSKVRKEEKGDGLKLILVDISPSCAEIRDACYAAALAIAEADSDVVVYCHFNGYFDYEDGKSIGARYKEVPIITDEDLSQSMQKFEDFLITGKLSGAIAFGDTDAVRLYALLGKYTPTVWMTPHDEYEAKRSVERRARSKAYFDKATLYVVPNVNDARSAVKGMEAVLKVKKS